MLAAAHLQPKEQPANLDHSEGKPLVLPDLPETQGEDHHKVPKSNSNDYVNTDLGAGIECTGCGNRGGLAQGLYVLEHMPVHCKRKHSC